MVRGGAWSGRWVVAAVVVALAGGVVPLALPQATVVSGAAGSPSACEVTTSGGDWVSYGHDASNSRDQDQEHTIGVSNASQLVPKWVFSTTAYGDTGTINSTPVEAGGCVFFGTTAGNVYALSAATGSKVWSAALGGSVIGAPVVDGNNVDVIVSYGPASPMIGPYAVALNRTSGAVVWQSQPVTGETGTSSNSSAEVFGRILFLGYSAPTGEPTGQGGYALINADTGKIMASTTTISPADQAEGFAGGGIWSSAAYDPATGYAFVGSGNPYSHPAEDVHTNSILKIDVDPTRSTFGQIVASFKGEIDQYSPVLSILGQTPICAATANDTFSSFPDVLCGQLDIDFGATPNLFKGPGGQLLVGDLQKSGVYHAAYASTMTSAWSTVVGLPCQLCNAASTATDGSSIYAEGTPGGLLYSLAQVGGGTQWVEPVLDGVHYQSISTANGVVYDLDGNGFLNLFNAATGATLVKRPLEFDTDALMANFSSGGVAIADHTVFVGTDGGPGGLLGSYLVGLTADLASVLPTTGYVIAYGLPG